MFPILLAVILAAQTDEPGWIGAITCTMDQVVVHRQGDRYQGRSGAGVKIGDRVTTSTGGGASLFLYAEQVLHLTAETDIELRNDDHGMLILLHHGEARITNGVQQSISLSTALTRVRIERAIVRLSTASSFDRIAVENGHADLTMADGRTMRLNQIQELRINAHDRAIVPVTFTNSQWTIRPADYQAAATRAASLANTSARPPTHGKPNCCPPRTRPTEPSGDEPPASDTQDPATQNQQQAQPAQAQDQNVTNYSVSAASSLSLGSLASASFGGSASAGYNADANQSTLQGQLMGSFNNNGVILPAGSPFPGNIHVITGETRYNFSDVMLTPGEQLNVFPGGNPAYWSIGLGAIPQTQVSTDLQTASNAVPTAVAIPRFEAYVLRLDQYGTVDAALNPAAAEANNVGTFGFLGMPPTAPTITGADPLLDARSANQINPRATFATGEFRLTPNGNTVDLAIRSSDQDRTIVKDLNNNDALDMVKPNADESFREVADPRFFPAAPLVQVPVRNNNFRSSETTYSNLDLLRRAAVTTLMADQLHDYSRRTGQTRFVIREADGRQRIVDISGYQR